ncbi:MAG TPA: hypothetical protein VN442_09290 [Bryobacteraceae bacterium]|nr:hypothetical protein [Bryobacteraceae bacterium]
MISRIPAAGGLACAVLFTTAVTAWGNDVPRLSYSKEFPGSMPPYIGITVDGTGAGEYKEAHNDDQPIRFKLKEAEAAEIFSLVEKLENFRRPLESPLKVAFMGTKTFRIERGAEKAEVKFNFSEDLAARALADWFERIAESEQHLVNLERTVKYDKLGVLKALLLLEASLDRKRLVAVEQYLPMLDRVAKNATYMHTARVRAAGIAEAIRATK